ncbi:4-demethylwyosine synthase TYW1 [Candidatus Woesearchaeota archaeon]|nr:4-demethylwyosine synthase TYW1 [Candidatus Woesearchaeota archaeon]
MPESYKAVLQNQQYGLIGNHSAVKICTWTKKSLRGEGVCYKQKFYGIRSHLCCQMTPALGLCQNKCIFCWRSLDENQKIKSFDEPKKIIEQSVIAQKRLLSGFGGLDKVDKEQLEEAQTPMHYAISLSGEPTLYPQLSELIKELHNAGKSTFLVTNGMVPNVLEKVEMPTQLYLSIDAPNKEIFELVDQPKLGNGWDCLLKSLDVLKRLKDKTRTTIRITALKGYNMVEPQNYAVLLERANPTYVEVKAYMFVGSSRQRLSIDNMPRHHEVVEFAKQICEHCDYKIIDEQVSSRVVLLMKEDLPNRIMQWEKS